MEKLNPYEKLADGIELALQFTSYLKKKPTETTVAGYFDSRKDIATGLDPLFQYPLFEKFARNMKPEEEAALMYARWQLRKAATGYSKDDKGTDHPLTYVQKQFEQSEKLEGIGKNVMPILYGVNYWYKPKTPGMA